MAVLSDADRAEITSQFMRENPDLLPACLKADVRAAVNATDVWMDSNQGGSSTNTGFNSDLPATFRTNASTKQKYRLFFLVGKRRFELV